METFKGTVKKIGALKVTFYLISIVKNTLKEKSRNNSGNFLSGIILKELEGQRRQ